MQLVGKTAFPRAAMWSIVDIVTMISDTIALLITLSLFVFMSESRVLTGYSISHQPLWTRGSLINQVDTRYNLLLVTFTHEENKQM